MALAVSPPSRFCRWHPRASMAYRLLQSRLIWGLTSPVPYIIFASSRMEKFIQRFFSPPARPKKEAAHKMALDMESVRERDWLAVWGITNIRPAKNEIGGSWGLAAIASKLEAMEEIFVMLLFSPSL